MVCCDALLVLSEAVTNKVTASAKNELYRLAAGPCNETWPLDGDMTHDPGQSDASIETN